MHLTYQKSWLSKQNTVECQVFTQEIAWHAALQHLERGLDYLSLAQEKIKNQSSVEND